MESKEPFFFLWRKLISENQWKSSFYIGNLAPRSRRIFWYEATLWWSSKLSITTNSTSSGPSSLVRSHGGIVRYDVYNLCIWTTFEGCFFFFRPWNPNSHQLRTINKPHKREKATLEAGRKELPFIIPCNDRLSSLFFSQTIWSIVFVSSLFLFF